MILVVDDDDSTREITAAYLRIEGYRVRTAADGIQALRVLADETARLLVVDLSMPNMDGETFITRCRDNRYDAPIIIISAAMSADRVARNLAVAAVLHKPFTNEELLPLVHYLYGTR